MNNLARNTDSMQKATSQSSSFFEFELLKNIDQPIPVILVKVDTYTLHSNVRGYHAYMNIWNSKLGDNDVEVKHEVNNEHDKFAIAIFHSKRIVGHVPKNLRKFFYQFLSLQKQPPEVFYKKKVFLEISQNSQENTCARVSFLIKLHASGLQLY